MSCTARESPDINTAPSWNVNGGVFDMEGDGIDGFWHPMMGASFFTNMRREHRDSSEPTKTKREETKQHPRTQPGGTPKGGPDSSLIRTMVTRTSLLVRGQTSQAYGSAPLYPCTSTPGTPSKGLHFNTPPTNPDPGNPPVPGPSFHPTGNIDCGEPDKVIRSPHTRMRAAHPTSHTTHTLPPQQKHPAPPTMSPTVSPGNEIIIAVMGVSGTGKSYFIREVSGISDTEVSDDLHSCTSKARPYSFPHAGVKITLIDTPGFNTIMSDTDVLKEICDWTSRSYKNGRLLSGIIYLHRITDACVDDSSLKHLRMFQRLCGLGALQNVLLTTTQWSNVDQALGEFREDNLLRREDLWGGLISNGASYMRFIGTKENGLGLISHLMAKKPKVLDIQHQLVDQCMTLAETDAGKFMNEESVALQKKYQENLEKLEREHQKAVQEKDGEMKEILEYRHAKAREKLEKAEAERKLLDLHEAKTKKLEEAERKREEERKRNERVVIAIASKDISVLSHYTSIFTSYKTRGRLIYDIDDTREFVKDPVPIKIHYQYSYLAAVEVAVKTIAELFDDGMSSSNYISYNGGHYQCKSGSSIKRGDQKFIIFRRT